MVSEPEKEKTEKPNEYKECYVMVAEVVLMNTNKLEKTYDFKGEHVILVKNNGKYRLLHFSGTELQWYSYLIGES